MGYYIDEFLSWDQQIKHIASKLASSNFAIARSKNVLPLKIRKTIYDSLFKSHLEYGIMAWGGAQLGKLKQIKILQKSASEMLQTLVTDLTLIHYSKNMKFLNLRICTL